MVARVCTLRSLHVVVELDSGRWRSMEQSNGISRRVSQSGLKPLGPCCRVERSSGGLDEIWAVVGGMQGTLKHHD